jgi:hypothetical protein
VPPKDNLGGRINSRLSHELNLVRHTFEGSASSLWCIEMQERAS